jgi:hypothetical protein
MPPLARRAQKVCREGLNDFWALLEIEWVVFRYFFDKCVCKEPVWEVRMSLVFGVSQGFCDRGDLAGFSEA